MIHVTRQRSDPELPWQSGHPSSTTGTGFLIGERKILTNAHVVSDARFIEVRKDGEARRFPARVIFVADDCDLAALTVDDPEFFEGTRPLELANIIPRLTDEVLVVGFPVGGSRVSVTRGIVSRIDYATYAHSGVDIHLVLQVDAAINPGNSGGPVMIDDKVIGVAFQGIPWGENLGYAIPLPVIERFLRDIEDDRYNGYPELGVAYLSLRNPALAAAYSLPANKSGALIVRVDPFGSAAGLVKPGDILTSIDGEPIANDGTILIDRDRVEFAEILERKLRGEAIEIELWRSNALHRIDVPLLDVDDPFIYRNRYNALPRYVVAAGMLFEPLTREHILRVARGAQGPAILFLAHFAKNRGYHKDRDEFVLLTRLFPHAVNTYAEQFANRVVVNVNNHPIRRLDDVREAFGKPVGDFHILRFFGSRDYLVIDAAEAALADLPIRKRYGIPAPYRLTETIE